MPGGSYYFLNVKNKKSKRNALALLAAGEGFEPSQTESESVVLPLHNPAIFSVLSAFFVLLSREHKCYYIRFMGKVKHIFTNFKKILGTVK